MDGKVAQVVAARRRGVRRRAAAHRHRQAAEARAARAVQGPPPAHRSSLTLPHRRSAFTPTGDNHDRTLNSSHPRRHRLGRHRRPCCRRRRPQAQISDDVVRIGVMADQTGPYSGNGGPGSVLAARMAVEDFGGKVNGKPIELVVADDQNKPDVGLNIARKWIENDKVDAIVGGSASSIALGVQTLMKEKQKPYLIAGTVTADLTGKSCSPMNFQFLVDTYSLPKAGVQTLLKQGIKTFYFVTVDYAFGAALQADATRFIEAARRQGGRLGQAPAGHHRLLVVPAAGAGQQAPRRSSILNAGARPVERAEAGGRVPADQERPGRLACSA